jgi:hypothetical protein
MAYMLIEKIKINYKLYKDNQEIRIYVLIVYIIYVKCANIMMSHHL